MSDTDLRVSVRFACLAGDGYCHEPSVDWRTAETAAPDLDAAWATVRAHLLRHLPNPEEPPHGHAA